MVWKEREHFLSLRAKGRFRVLRGLSSPFLPSVRDATVFLPPSYAKSRRRYPVVYMQDGNNLFDPATAFLGRPWRLEERLDELWRSGAAEEFIVVGLHNTIDRHEEYTPSRDPIEGQGGLATGYLRFVTETVKPLVDRRFRTLRGAAHTGIGGSSLGGLLALYAGFSRPDAFGRVAAFSPSFWWDLRFLFHYVAMRAHYPFYRALRIWMDMGTREGDDPAMCDEMIRELRREGELLAKAGFGPDRLAVRAVEGGTHDEPSWGARSGEVFAFLFPRRKPCRGARCSGDANLAV